MNTILLHSASYRFIANLAIISISVIFIFKAIELNAADGVQRKYDYFYAKNQDTPIFDKPDSSSRIIFRAPKGYPFVLDREKEKSVDWENDKWIPYESTVFGKGWLQVKDVVYQDQFVPVAKNWPFRFLAYEEHEYVVLYFNRDGSLKNYMPNQEARKLNRLFISNDIVVWGTEEKKEFGNAIAIYDKKNMRLCPPNLIVSCDQFFSKPHGFWKYGLFTQKIRPIYDNYGECVVNCKKQPKGSDSIEIP